MTKVFKFGGASVKDADAVRNVAAVLQQHNSGPVVVVISAMGKTTNNLERLTKAYFYRKEDPFQIMEEVKAFHYQILETLFEDKNHPVYEAVNNAFVEIEWAIEDEPTGTFDFEYDQIVSIGEMLSTRIVSAYLHSTGIENEWLDVRDVIKTDNTYREGKVDWELSQKGVKNIERKVAQGTNTIVTQGFIGVTSENFTTTLGREGSDFSASILAYLLNAESVTIWKDVPGILNADPRYFNNTTKLNHISYREAIELAFNGAKVIHPKTIKPLQNKSIPLFVRSFIDPNAEGTIINKATTSDSLIPSYIFKMDQVLISITPHDFSFIVEENLSEIFGHFARHAVKVNMMQNSAINFSVSVDNDEQKIPELLKDLKKNYNTRYNDRLELITVRHYDQTTLDMLLQNKAVLVEQKSRHTVRLVVKDKE